LIKYAQEDGDERSFAVRGSGQHLLVRSALLELTLHLNTSGDLRKFESSQCRGFVTFGVVFDQESSSFLVTLSRD
jgi:hypothetical protein